MTLTDEQVEYIERQIAASRIHSAALREDLLDHFCCLVELHMGKGDAFETAYEKAYGQTTPNGFDEIQRETVFLLNYNKIMFMKKFMYVSGFIFTLAASSGLLFRLLHWPGANVLMFSGIFGGAFIFAPLMLMNHFKAQLQTVLSERMKWIFGVLSVVLFALASAFKLMHLQGANVLLVSSFIVFGLGFLPFLFFRMYKKSVESV